MSEAIEVVQAFLGSLNISHADSLAAIEKFCTDDCIWKNTGLPTMDGKQAMLGFLDKFRELSGLGQVEIETLSIAADGNTVLTERVDHLKTDDGTLIMSMSIMGRFDVRGGQISLWSDYFDATPFQPMLAALGG
jgi:limonene-1,2-epoxide hydrolase